MEISAQNVEPKPWSLDQGNRQPVRPENEDQAIVGFIVKALAELGGCPPARLLDFGCGSGGLVRSLRLLGLDAWGCDIRAYWEDSDDPVVKHLRVIDLESPLRLPFPGESFDAVVSTSVLEHAQNKDEIFREIHRILTAEGQMLHLFPGKFYLPLEPHIYVPLVSWFWPYVPRFWLAGWALLGIRNEFQRGMPWRQVANLNSEFVRRGVSYWTHDRLRRSVRQVFGNCQFPNKYYVLHAPGGVAKVCRNFPFKSISGWAIGRFRFGMLYAKKPK